MSSISSTNSSTISKIFGIGRQLEKPYVKKTIIPVTSTHSLPNEDDITILQKTCAETIIPVTSTHSLPNEDDMPIPQKTCAETITPSTSTHSLRTLDDANQGSQQIDETFSRTQRNFERGETSKAPDKLQIKTEFLSKQEKPKAEKESSKKNINFMDTIRNFLKPKCIKSKNNNTPVQSGTQENIPRSTDHVDVSLPVVQSGTQENIPRSTDRDEKGYQSSISRNSSTQSFNSETPDIIQSLDEAIIKNISIEILKSVESPQANN